MKFQEAEFSNAFNKDFKLKTKGIIILKDNRLSQNSAKAYNPDFRQSGFKQTEIDPFEQFAEITLQQDEDELIEALNRKVLILESRVQRLQNHTELGLNFVKTIFSEKGKKPRRKYADMPRNFKCSFEECERFYGSQTSLRHHLKHKHKVISKASGKQSSWINKIQESE